MREQFHEDGPSDTTVAGGKLLLLQVEKDYSANVKPCR